MATEVDPVQIYSSKAERYAGHRWDYSPAALEAVVAETGLSSASVLADVGSGTGILSRHFVRKVALLFAVEPNPAMRSEAEKVLSSHSAFRSIAGRAEGTNLPGRSVDIITVGQSLHWFDADRAVAEFCRILRTNGWIVVVNNIGGSPELDKALKEIYVEENGVDLNIRQVRSKPTQLSRYFGGGHLRASRHGFVLKQNWESFIGGLLSDSCAPDEDHVNFSCFEEAARGVFDTFSTGGWLEIQVLTELHIGRPLFE